MTQRAWAWGSKTREHGLWFGIRQHWFEFQLLHLPAVWPWQCHLNALILSSVQLLSLVWLFVTPWTAARQAFPVHHQLPEPTQTHVHHTDEAIQPSHPQSSPSPPTFNLSQHQGLFQWVSSSHQVAKVSASASVLSVNVQDWFPLGWTGWISLQSKGLSRVFSNTTYKLHKTKHAKHVRYLTCRLLGN